MKLTKTTVTERGLVFESQLPNTVRQMHFPNCFDLICKYPALEKQESKQAKKKNIKNCIGPKNILKTLFPLNQATLQARQ